MQAIRKLTSRQVAGAETLTGLSLPDVCLDIHGARIRIHSNLEETIRVIRDSYAFFVVPGDSGTWNDIVAISADGPRYPELMDRLYPRSERPRNCLIPIPYRRVYWIGKSAHLHYFTGAFFTAMMESLLYDRFLIVHGAAVVRKKGIVFPGALRCGKTTLTLQLIYAGFRFASDDVVLIDRETFEIHPYPRPLNLRQETLYLVPELHKEYHRMDYSVTFGEPRWFLMKTEAVAKPFRFQFLVMPKIGAVQPVMEVVRPATAALALVKQSFYPMNPAKRYEHTGENLPLLGRLLDGVACYQLLQGSPDATVKLLLDTTGA